jgi:hypothetical protein
MPGLLFMTWVLEWRMGSQRNNPSLGVLLLV